MGRRRGCKVRCMGGEIKRRMIVGGREQHTLATLSRNLCRTHKNEWGGKMER